MENINSNLSVCNSPQSTIPEPEYSKTPLKKKKHIPTFDGTKSKTKQIPFKKINDKHLAMQELREKSNLSDTQIANALGYHRSYIPNLKKKLDKTSLVSHKAKKLARKAVIETLEMQPVKVQKVSKNGEIVEVDEKPTHSNRLTAAAMVLDRSEPIIQRHQNESVNINLDGTLLDYSNFRRKE